MCSPEEIVKTARRMAELGLVLGSFGNVSCRSGSGERVLITPTKLDYSAMEPEDIVALDLEGRKLEGRREPSSEFRMHLAIYRAREDVRAIVHAHGVFGLALSLVASELPALTEEMEHGLGGPVKVAPYAPAGSQELADRAAELLRRGGKALILARHGLVGLGKDLEEALFVCRLVERAAQIYLLARAGE
ncbi:MAG: class II aldolase/adducin family protein [Candidatus Acetothermia bacterium]|jgi:L-fuculose-phosphate aldolase|nr:class II aldolase/adducin family protein [Candidatus Acetothermia bacterium]MDH7505421.1 class II aldolase/adducin family protein [Candidatus Acetothermia bacterium]